LVRLGAQNCHWEPEGAYTGEVAAPMLRGLVDYVMVGHSERRAAGETDDQVADKVAAVAGAGLVPILFVGEDEQGDDALAQTEQRLRHGLRGVDLTRQHVLVVYEPTWAIGAERPAGAEYVGPVVEHLKAELRRLGSSRPEVLYGGTVADENVEQFARLDALDGVGATRGSLDADRFLAMIDRVIEV
ncbi:MAG: triose-phosphate isomerase, partial [Actinobacteria bacterium]|nr:triose-phosphate isomerase [Actinomycetota bacterium]